MKNFVIATAITLLAAGFTACGNSGRSDGAIKVDSVVNPADNTNAVTSDSTRPPNAPALDTVAGGKSTSSGIPDSGSKR
ncbi:MAG TPA: hypothetical protein VG738_15565 [Chitinophagaceae bacterium]|nr:hypothetical protein [Chitinophagaceae bacterium]